MHVSGAPDRTALVKPKGQSSFQYLLSQHKTVRWSKSFGWRPFPSNISDTMTVRGGRAAKWRTALLFLSISMASYAGMVFTVNTVYPCWLWHTRYIVLWVACYITVEKPLSVYMTWGLGVITVVHDSTKFDWYSDKLVVWKLGCPNIELRERRLNEKLDSFILTLQLCTQFPCSYLFSTFKKLNWFYPSSSSVKLKLNQITTS